MFIALLYASIPLAHQILVDDSVTPFEYESTEETEATYLTEIGMDQYLDTIRSNQSGELVNTIRLMQWGVEEPIWSTDILHGNVSYEFSELIVVPGPDWVTINTGAVINTMLDDRSAKIKSDLDEARTLREEALDELHQFQRLHREAAEEAKAILKNAEATAERIRENAEAAAKETIKRREQQATAKIKAAEAAMIGELRDKAASLAVASAAQIITSKLDDKAGLALVDDAAGEIEKLN